MKISSNLKFIPDLILLAATSSLFFYNLINYGSDGYYIVVYGHILGMNSSPERIISLILGGDSTYQLKFAADYINNGVIGDWVLNLWPPGLPVLNIIFIKLFGSDYYLLKALIFSAFIYTLAIYVAYRCLKIRGQEYLIILLLLIIQFSESVKNSLFNNLLFISSDFYCFCILLALIPILLMGGRKGIFNTLCISVLLSLLAYFRSYYFLLINFSTILGLCGLFIFLGHNYFYNPRKKTFNLTKNPFFRGFASVFIMTWLLLIPWITILKFEQKPFLWTVTDQAWAAQWRLDLPEFLAGLNTPCLIEKEVCIKLLPFQLEDTWATPVLGSDFYKKLSLSTFISHPFKWYAQKLKFFHIFWFEGQLLSDINSINTCIQYFILFGILIMCIYLIISWLYCFIKKYRNKNFISSDYEILASIFIIFFIFNCMVFTFAHFEPRYSLPLKISIYFIFIYKLISYIKNTKSSIFRLGWKNK